MVIILYSVNVVHRIVCLFMLQVNLGHRQFLFATPRCKNHHGVVCLRHDVDGVVWKPVDIEQTGSSPWEHTSTFNAFGYVSASKQNRKYMLCAPDFSYSLITDFSRHLYIYRQHIDLSSSLRNRKLGLDVLSVAKQHLITLEGTDDIVGLCTSNSLICVLCRKSLHVIRV